LRRPGIISREKRGASRALARAACYSVGTMNPVSHSLRLALLACVLVSPVFAGPVEDLASVLHGRTGHASEDRRSDDHGPFGIKIGCHGDTLDCTVTITGVSGTMSGDTAIMEVTYDGTYQRQGWAIPCQKVSSDLGGLEERHVWGTFTFRVTGKAFQKPTLTWGDISAFGEVEGATHDSNVFAERAVQSAIATAF
jgi:hypothetical protein